MARSESEQAKKKREEFELSQADILSDVPPQFHSAFRSLAWESGHAYGYSEVLSHLRELVDALKDPIAMYGASLSGR